MLNATVLDLHRSAACPNGQGSARSSVRSSKGLRAALSVPVLIAFGLFTSPARAMPAASIQLFRLDGHGVRALPAIGAMLEAASQQQSAVAARQVALAPKPAGSASNSFQAEPGAADFSSSFSETSSTANRSLRLNPQLISAISPSRRSAPQDSSVLPQGGANTFSKTQIAQTTTTDPNNNQNNNNPTTNNTNPGSNPNPGSAGTSGTGAGAGTAAAGTAAGLSTGLIIGIAVGVLVVAGVIVAVVASNNGNDNAPTPPVSQ